jgi:hypothetical protein
MEFKLWDDIIDGSFELSLKEMITTRMESEMMARQYIDKTLGEQIDINIKHN